MHPTFETALRFLCARDGRDDVADVLGAFVGACPPPAPLPLNDLADLAILPACDAEALAGLVNVGGPASAATLVDEWAFTHAGSLAPVAAALDRRGIDRGALTVGILADARVQGWRATDRHAIFDVEEVQAALDAPMDASAWENAWALVREAPEGWPPVRAAKERLAADLDGVGALYGAVRDRLGEVGVAAPIGWLLSHAGPPRIGLPLRVLLVDGSVAGPVAIAGWVSAARARPRWTDAVRDDPIAHPVPGPLELAVAEIVDPSDRAALGEALLRGWMRVPDASPEGLRELALATALADRAAMPLLESFVADRGVVPWARDWVCVAAVWWGERERATAWEDAGLVSRKWVAIVEGLVSSTPSDED